MYLNTYQCIWPQVWSWVGPLSVIVAFSVTLAYLSTSSSEALSHLAEIVCGTREHHGGSDYFSSHSDILTSQKQISDSVFNILFRPPPQLRWGD